MNTKPEEYSMIVTWEPRPASAPAAGEMAERTLEVMARQCPAIWADWYETGKTKSQALARRIKPGALTERFAKGHAETVRTSQGLLTGFDAGVWNGEESGMATRVEFWCGYEDDTREMPNHVIINMPTDHGWRGKYLSGPRIETLLVDICSIWCGRQAACTSHELRQVLPMKQQPLVRYVGWICYLPRAKLDGVVFPEGVREHEVAGGGWLIDTGRDNYAVPFVASDAQRVAGTIEALAAKRAIPMW